MRVGATSGRKRICINIALCGFFGRFCRVMSMSMRRVVVIMYYHSCSEGDQGMGKPKDEFYRRFLMN